MSSGGLFSFRPELGESPETLKRRRAVAQAMLGGGAVPTTIGGGLSSLGSSIAGALMERNFARQEAAGQAGAAGLFGNLLGGLGGGGTPVAGETAALPGVVPAGGTDMSVAGIPDVATQEAYIRASAPKYGVDPDVAVNLAKHEGLQPGTWQSNVVKDGVRETSYGPFQLHTKGLGAGFEGDLTDPSTWQAQIDYALKNAAKSGWKPWYGRGPAGIGEWEGINRGGGTAAVTSALAGSDTPLVREATLRPKRKNKWTGWDEENIVPARDESGEIGVAGAVGDPGPVGATSAFDFSPFATGGAAARGDSFSGLQPEMSSGLGAMISSAPADIQNELRVMSGFRSPETQERLWQGALKKYGSASAARKWVAPPGRSQHGFGNAIDWKFASKRAREWAHQNAGKFGFSFPLSNEPWHMEVAGARGRPSGASPPSASGIGRPLDGSGGSVFALAGGGGQPAVTEALRGGIGGDTLTPVPAVRDTIEALSFDPAAKDDFQPIIPAAPAFVPAGGATPYEGGIPGTDYPAIPTPPVRPADPVAAPPVAPVAPAGAGVAPVAQALGVDPLPQTSGLMDPVASAGHEALSPGVSPVAAALTGGAGTDTLAGGGGRGIIGRLFGGGPRAPAGGAANPVATAMAGAGGPAGTPGAPGAGGGLSDTAQKAIAVIQNPWSNDGQLAIAKTMLDQELQQADPKYRVELQAAIENLRQAQTPTRAMTDAEKRDQGIDPTINARIDAKGNVTEGPKIEPKIINNTAYHPVTGQALWSAPPGTKLLTTDEAKAMRLPLGAGNWMVTDGKPSVVPGTEPSDPKYNDYVREALQARDAAKASGVPEAELPPLPVDRLTWTKAGTISVSQTVGGEPGADAALRKKLSESEGERWSKIKEAGDRAASRSQSLEVLMEALNAAPDGPLTGRLLEWFPGFSTAGDLAASLISQMAPTFHVAGTGSQSDIEYAGVLRGLPGLSKDPVANKLIGQAIMAKAQIDIERSNIITQAENEVISIKEARTKLQELNRRSILTPQMEFMLNKVGAFDKPADDPLPPKPEGYAGEWPTAAEWAVMSDDDKALYEGGN